MINTTTKADLEDLVLKQDANLVELSTDIKNAFKKSFPLNFISEKEFLSRYICDRKLGVSIHDEGNERLLYKTSLETLRKLRMLDLPAWKSLVTFDDLVFYTRYADIRVNINLLNSKVRFPGTAGEGHKFSQDQMNVFYENLYDAFKPYVVEKAGST